MPNEDLVKHCEHSFGYSYIIYDVDLYISKENYYIIILYNINNVY